jgi:tetratricopeptide (TPR) repeat protein
MSFSRNSVLTLLLMTLATASGREVRAISESPDALTKAYSALSAKSYDDAINLFRQALSIDNANAAAHKDLAYTLLKTGESAVARDEFARALQLQPDDETAALEYAFLAYETKQPIAARREFNRLRQKGSAGTKATAQQAFENIDRPLKDGIARWKTALSTFPNPQDISTYSAHWELAQLAEQRDELELAAEQYAVCHKLKPRKTSLLLDLSRTWQGLNKTDEARALLLAASRSEDSYTAETALELWGSRYPYPYEFLQALEFDPQNINLRRELAFLYLAMNQKSEAITQLQRILTLSPEDELSRKQLDSLTRKSVSAAPVHQESIPTSRTVPALDAKAMGLKSFGLGYARDAIRYLQQAHEIDPDDAEVMLKLGFAYNWANDDTDALTWFERARRSADSAVAAEATKAYRNLSGDAGAQTTVWALPMFSTRWHDVFTYGQIKRTMPLPWQPVNRWVSLYFSTRFLGDLKSSLAHGTIAPQYLSESSFIFGAGISTKTWHHTMAWAEAGESVKYLSFKRDVGAAVPDYRGGLEFSKGFGQLLGSQKPGPFFETVADSIFISRYDRDWILTSQNRTGYTFTPPWGGSAQALWNTNVSHDLKAQYWANTAEFGPGLKVHFNWLRPGVYLTTDLLRGVYLNNTDNPRRPNYNDVRVGLWYAFTR